MSQWISSCGKDSPSAATAGSACTISPIELKRITRKRFVIPSETVL
jgi:hypothetical protein